MIFCVLKLWFKVTDPVVSKSLLIEVTCPILKLVNPEPSPENLDAVTCPVPKSTELLAKVASTCAAPDMIPDGILTKSE